MRFTKYLLAGAAAAFIGGARIVSADTDVDIQFYKWQNTMCADPEAGDDDKIGDGKCKSFDHTFNSFVFDSRFMNWANFWNNDWDSPSCEVIIFQDTGCQGMAWTTGILWSGLGSCFAVPPEMGEGHSAAVVCDTQTGAARFLVDSDIPELSYDE